MEKVLTLICGLGDEQSSLMVVFSCASEAMQGFIYFFATAYLFLLQRSCREPQDYNPTEITSDWTPRRVVGERRAQLELVLTSAQSEQTARPNPSLARVRCCVVHPINDEWEWRWSTASTVSCVKAPLFSTSCIILKSFCVASCVCFIWWRRCSVPLHTCERFSSPPSEYLLYPSRVPDHRVGDFFFYITVSPQRAVWVFTCSSSAFGFLQQVIKSLPFIHHLLPPLCMSAFRSCSPRANFLPSDFQVMITIIILWMTCMLRCKILGFSTSSGSHSHKLKFYRCASAGYFQMMVFCLKVWISHFAVTIPLQIWCECFLLFPHIYFLKFLFVWIFNKRTEPLLCQKDEASCWGWSCLFSDCRSVRRWCFVCLVLSPLSFEDRSGSQCWPRILCTLVKQCGHTPPGPSVLSSLEMLRRSASRFSLTAALFQLGRWEIFVFCWFSSNQVRLEEFWASFSFLIRKQHAYFTTYILLLKEKQDPSLVQ